MNRTAFALCLIVVSALVTVAVPVRSVAATPAAHSIPVCPGALAGSARCSSFVLTDSRGIPLTSSSPTVGSYGPAQFHGGYNLPCSVGGPSAQAVCAPPNSFGGQTIGIVDAYDDRGGFEHLRHPVWPTRLQHIERMLHQGKSEWRRRQLSTG